MMLAAVALHFDPSPARAGEPVRMASYNEEALLFSEIPSVIGASKYEQKVTEAPSSVSIVTSEDIKKYGYRTLSDILRSVRSFYVTYDRDYSYVGVRGFAPPGDYNSRILLLIDSHRTNDNIYDQALIGTEGMLDVDLIDRVEVIRGPGSSLYGSNAFFAVVNIITKRGRDLRGAEVSTERLSYDAYRGRLTYGNKFSNGAEAVLSGSAYNSEGRSLSFPAGVAENADYDRYHSFFTKVAWNDLTLGSAYVSRTKGIPTGAFGTDFNDPANKTKDEHAYLDLKYDRSFDNQTDVEARVYYDYYRYTGDYMYTGLLNKDLGYGDWWGSEIRATKKFFWSQRVTLGGEYQGNLRQDQRNYNIDGSSPWEDARKSRILAVYLQDEVALAKNATLNAGIRYDHYSTFGGTTNPRIAFIFNPTEKSAVKMLYGSAFRTPNAFELYYAITGLNVPNPGLNPEKINTYELVYEQYLGEGVRISASGYSYRIRDLISQVDTGAGTMFDNIDKVTANGAELEIENKWSNGMEGRISYSLQRAEDKMTGEPIPNSPAQLGKLIVSIPVVTEKLLAGIEEQYLSRRRTLAGNYAEGFYLTNLTFSSRNPINRLEVSASIYNLLDKKYSDPVSADLPLDTVQQNGRNYRLKLTYAF